MQRDHHRETLRVRAQQPKRISDPLLDRERDVELLRPDQHHRRNRVCVRGLVVVLPAPRRVRVDIVAPSDTFFVSVRAGLEEFSA